MKFEWIVSVVLIVVISIFLIAFIFIRKTYNKLDDDYSELSNLYYQLKRDYNALKEEYRKLSNNYNELSLENYRLSSQMITSK